MKRSLFLVSTLVLSFAAHAGEFRLENLNAGTYSLENFFNPPAGKKKTWQRIEMIKTKLDISLQDKNKTPEKLNAKVIADMGRDMRLLKDGEKTQQVASATFQITESDHRTDKTKFNFIQIFEHKIVSEVDSVMDDSSTPRYCHTAIFYDVLNEHTGDVRARAFMLENEPGSDSDRGGFWSFKSKEGKFDLHGR